MDRLLFNIIIIGMAAWFHPANHFSIKYFIYEF